MDFMTETTYLCEPATESEFLDTFWRTIDGSPVSSKKLQQITCRISDSTIPEESIRSLWVIGNADSYCNEALKTAKLNPGVYINRSTNQLLLIHPEETDICKYTKRFGKQLTNLTLSLTAFSNLDLSSLTSLVHLWIGHDACLSRISGLEHLNQLSELKISKCDKLNSLSSFGNSAQLTTLFLSECSSLTQLQGLENLTQLKKLSLIRCDSLVQLPNLGKLTLLKELSLSECINLTQLDGLESLTQLRKLSLFKCRSLVQLPGLEKLIRLKEATLAQCSSLIKLPTLDNLSQIIELSLSGCSNLRVLPDGIRNMKSLRRLVLRHLRLQYLPDWLPEIAERFSLEKYSCRNIFICRNLFRKYASTNKHISDCDIIVNMFIFNGSLSV